jgi:ABC-type antimicrobial peptide transport system permease subunit
MISNFPGDDPWIVASVPVLLIGVAVSACWLPAYRTTKINPVLALGGE